MKIALTGTAATGKTTLAVALVRQLDVVLLEENLRAVVAALIALKQIRRDGNDDTGAKNTARRACLNWLNESRAQAQSLTGFVADRTAADIFMRWTSFRLSRNEAEFWRLFRRCKTQMSQLDWIVVPPLKRMGNDETNEAGIRRTESHDLRFYDHSSIIGILLQMVPAKRLIFIPDRAVTVEQRLAFVMLKLRPDHSHPVNTAMDISGAPD
jgi:hypothetical protein